MSDIVDFFVFKVLPAILAMFFTFYLAYTISSQARVKVARSRHKKDAPGHDFYCKIYTPRFLVAWLFVTLFLILGVVFELYRGDHPTAFVAHFEFVALMVTALVGLLLLWSALRKR